MPRNKNGNSLAKSCLLACFNICKENAAKALDDMVNSTIDDLQQSLTNSVIGNDDGNWVNWGELDEFRKNLANAIQTSGELINDVRKVNQAMFKVVNQDLDMNGKNAATRTQRLNQMTEEQIKEILAQVLAQQNRPANNNDKRLALA